MEFLMQPTTYAGFPIARQICRPEYCRLSRSCIQNCRYAPVPRNYDDMLDTWSKLRRETKERFMFCFYLQFANPVKDHNYKLRRLAADASWSMRCFFAGETSREKLRWHFQYLSCYAADYDDTWEVESGISKLLESCLIDADPQLAAMTAVTAVFFREVCGNFINEVRMICKFLKFATDSDRCYRKMGACRITLSVDDCRLIEQFERGAVDDLYLKRLAEVYGSTWRDVVIGPVRKCKTCGKDDRRLFTCGLCMQEHLKPKVRYCGKSCQRKDWQEHRKCHKSQFDPYKDFDYLRDFDAFTRKCDESGMEYLLFESP